MNEPLDLVDTLGEDGQDFQQGKGRMEGVLYVSSDLEVKYSHSLAIEIVLEIYSEWS